MKQLSITILALALWGGTALKAQAVPGSQETDSLFNKVLINGQSMGIPGISVAIGKGDSIYWSGTIGYADLKARTPIALDSKFGIGSITKTFVAVTALQLAKEGKLDLEKVPSDYLDTTMLPNIANLDQAPIRTLLNHQSGIPTFEFDQAWIRQGRGVSVRPEHLWGKAETLDYIDGQAALFAPGEAYEYSNTNYTLLGLIIEKITDNELHEEIRNRILKPLDLGKTFLESFEQVPGGYVANYHYATPEYLKVAGHSPYFPYANPYLIETSRSNLSTEWAAGGLVSTSHDLVKWAQALNTGDFLDKEIKEQYFTYHPPGGVANPNFQYAQGIYRIFPYYRGHAVLGHSGGVLGFSAMMFWIEDTDIIVVSLVNVGNMHSGLKRPPSSLFYQSILIPAVFEHFGIDKK
ncbi:MAG: class A beta-lactamase-related serine hydrolase [Muricauda sp. TMED12]|nr:MAG: class A beta-lactamase-related serine hydrolase [Muricauda sp. TMED12]